eukprot:357670-Rhodomonas_salina.1
MRNISESGPSMWPGGVRSRRRNVVFSKRSHYRIDRVLCPPFQSIRLEQQLELELLGHAAAERGL